MAARADSRIGTACRLRAEELQAAPVRRGTREGRTPRGASKPSAELFPRKLWGPPCGASPFLRNRNPRLQARPYYPLGFSAMPDTMSPPFALKEVDDY